MSTVADVIERLFRTYLYPPDYQPPSNFVTLAGANVNGFQTIGVGEWAVADDENLMRQDSIIEINDELLRVRLYDEESTTILAEQGVYGTPINDEYKVNDRIILSPPYPRFSAFQAVADNIIQLYPRLYTVTAANLVSVTGGVAGLNDDLAVEVVTTWDGSFSKGPDYHGTIVDYHPAIGDRAIMMNIDVGEIWLRYRRRMGRAESETDTLKDLGVDERWTNILIAGAAADLFVGRDLPASQVEWVSGVLQAENIEVGTRADLAVGLARYRELLIDRAAKEMAAEYKPRITMKRAGMARV